MVAWNKLGRTSLFGLDAEFCVDGGNHNLYALGIKTFDVPTFVNYTSELTALWASNPETQPSSFEIELFPTQAVKSVPDDATAYPYRDIQAQVYVASSIFQIHARSLLCLKDCVPVLFQLFTSCSLYLYPMELANLLLPLKNVHLRLSCQRNRLQIHRHQSQQPRPLRPLRLQPN